MTGTGLTEVSFDGYREGNLMGSRAMAVKAVQQYSQDRQELRALVHMWMIEFHVNIFAWPCVFLIAIPRTVG